MKNGNDYRLGIIGCGNMAEAIIKGVLSSGFLLPDEIIAYEIKPQRAGYIKSKYCLKFTDEISNIPLMAKNILLSVKPGDIFEVLGNLKDTFRPGYNSVISIAAGVSTNFIEEVLDCKPSVIRIMPNTPALVNKCMAAISKGIYADEADMAFSVSVIKSLGEYIIIDEKLQNAVTAISGSGPAYFFLFCEFMIEAAKKIGINGEDAGKLVVNTLVGSGDMLENFNYDTGYLIKMVASPKGTTEAALKSFNENSLEEIVAHAVDSALKRAIEIQGVIESRVKG